MIEAKHEPRPLRGAPMHEGVDGQRPMRPDEAALPRAHMIANRAATSGSIGKHPEILSSLSGIRVHDRQCRDPTAGTPAICNAFYGRLVMAVGRRMEAIMQADTLPQRSQPIVSRTP